MKRLLALIIFAFLVGSAQLRADAPDDQYVRIYNVIQEGDALNNKGNYAQALAKYSDAQASLQRFQKLYPDWNTKVISFRANYLAGRISTVTAKVPATPANPIIASTSTNGSRGSNIVGSAGTKSGQPVADPQLNTLHSQLRQLQADKILLEAKLKESLSVQPAPMDPRELSKAQERIQSLEKENDLLKVNLNQVKSQPVPDAKTFEQTQKALAESTRKLTEETEKANALSLEKTALQNKLNGLTAGAWNATAVEAAKKSLDDATRQLAEQKEAAAKSAAERESLLAKVKTLTADSDAAAALKLENQIIKKELADLRTASTSPGRVAESSKQLAQAQAQIAALLSDKEILHLEKVALEDRLKKANSNSVALNSRLSGAGRAEDAQRIRQLEREREDLQKKLELANRELNNRNNRALTAHVVEMENQMALLRARLDVFEARAVPYTAEELALFKHPEINLATIDAKPGKRSVKELPPGSAALVADAQKFFASRQYDRAEEKYLQVLRQDDKNVITLANLAEIQVERKRFDDAEKHLKQAVAIAPDDSYSWFVLGQLKFRQEKYDEALDALSRAARLNPQSAEIQNLLGLSLSEKGMRGPAETALRKAIQIQPDFADAHANLAVVYVTQKPPLVELARWHYQKARAAGAPHNSFLESRLNEQKTADAGS
jgi:tetratricopeptide (TPR) repeat protein